MMSLAEFHNGLRILMNIDQRELEAVGIIDRGDHNAWGLFRRNPFHWMIKASDADVQKLWKIMETRMKK